MLFNGMTIISDPNALAETTERRFPMSKNRSKRIHKKLVKRYGSEFCREPAIFKLANGTFIAHSVMYAEIQRQTKQALWSARNPV